MNGDLVILGCYAGTVVVSGALTTMGIVKHNYELKKDGYAYTKEYKDNIKKKSLKYIPLIVAWELVPGANLWFSSATFMQGYNKKCHEDLKKIEIGHGSIVKVKN